MWQPVFRNSAKMSFTRDKLNYSIKQNPHWRRAHISRSTSEMMTEITERRNEYENLPEGAKQFGSESFARAMAVDYIHNLNVGEMVGTQCHEDTEEVLKKFLGLDNQATTQSDGREAKETLNTYKAMNKFREQHETMDHTGLLTVQEICDIHRVLLEGLHTGCGEIRTTEVFTTLNDGLHFYPPPEVAEDQFYGLVDHHNMYMESCPKDKTSEEYTRYLFKCAARLLFEFVDTHPFGDGNGRMCRLLANYVLGLITPFPVSVYHTRNPARSGREHYINAIVRCRENPEEGPGELAAMLVEGAWRGWKSLFENLEGRQQRKPGIVIGPIVLKKSKCIDRGYVSDHVDQIWPRVQRRGVTSTKEQFVEKVVGATEAVDVSSLHGSQYKQITANVENDATVKIDLY